ncbi:MAG: hypothetical protein EPN14_08035 [Gallionella sp.]|nr:MAG: hypothetical protein EPN14_08035 [Gallionella sp.]
MPTITLPKTVFRRVEKLAKACKRTPDYIVTRILKDCLDYEEWKLEQIDAGLADIKAGRVISDDELWDKFAEEKLGMEIPYRSKGHPKSKA